MSGVLIPADFTFCLVMNERFSKRWSGRVGNDALYLANERIEYEQIDSTASRGIRVAVQVDFGGNVPAPFAEFVSDPGVLTLLPSIAARNLEREIDRRCSIRTAELRRAELTKAGRSADIRFERCPVCGADIDLSGLEPTPYIYCWYCDSLFSLDRLHVSDGALFYHCDQCGMYDRIHPITEFYFYSLVIVAGTRTKERYLCETCAWPVFWRTLALNLPFLFGVPFSLTIPVKILRHRDAAFGGLPQANRYACEGHYAAADPVYSRILERHPNHPGILTNMAVGHVNGADLDGGRAHAAHALRACAYYPPALRLLGGKSEG